MGALNNHSDHRKQAKLNYEDRLAGLALLGCVVPTVLLLFTLWVYETSPYLIGLVAIFLCILIAWVVASIRNRSLYQFRSLSNLLEAMIKGDYSMRARAMGKHGALQELIETINKLGETLTANRLSSVESQLLVDTIIRQIDVAIIALNEESEVTLHNPAATHLLGWREQSPNKTLPNALSEINRIAVGHSDVLALELPGRRGRFRIHKEQFREQGVSHDLVFISDVHGMLRAEERKAWQNLIRVLGHEINNSLSPIGSMSDTLSRQIDRLDLAEDKSERILQGLLLIKQRSSSLADFVDSYRKLGKLPEPDLEPVSIQSLVDHVSALITDAHIVVAESESLEVNADKDQLYQVLINVFKNAREAMEGQQQAIRVSWIRQGQQAVLYVDDQGSGISNPDNLFIPFYTTKSGGSGIGLVLCRQIIEAHGGHFSLQNHADKSGCRVTVTLPLA